MRIYFGFGLVFLAGIFLGCCLSRPTTVRAQESTTVTVTPVRAVYAGSHHPETLTVPGQVIGFQCGYILSR